MRIGLTIGLVMICSSAAALERVEKKNLIQSESPFSEGGKVGKSETRLSSKIEVTKTESGKLNGVSYRFWYTDGSGSFSGKKGNTLAIEERSSDNWNVRCVKDAMDDSVRCAASIHDLTVSVGKGGDEYIWVGSEHYPGTDVAVRVGAGTPYIVSSKDQFGPSLSRKLIEEFQQGGSVTTRYQQWPYKAYKDVTFDLYGFDEVFSYMKWAVKHID